MYSQSLLFYLQATHLQNAAQPNVILKIQITRAEALKHKEFSNANEADYPT
jgi:hypothetical protein